MTHLSLLTKIPAAPKARINVSCMMRAESILIYCFAQFPSVKQIIIDAMGGKQFPESFS